MGYKTTLAKEQCYIGAEVKDAYHSIDEVSLIDGKAVISVGVYASRDSKYETAPLRVGNVTPHRTVDDMLDSDGMPISADAFDLSSFTSIVFVPRARFTRPKLGEYRLSITPGKLFMGAMPYDLHSQRETLYPVVKKLLGHADAEDVFEEVPEDDVHVESTDDVS